MRRTIGMVIAAFLIASGIAEAQPAREKIIIDSDIGDDIDDAFAVALALSSPELDVLGFSAAFGDTETRAKMFDHMLGETGHSDIPVAMGTPVDVNRNAFTQRRYAEGGSFARTSHPGSVDFVLGQARKYPGQITLVAIGPLANVGAMIDHDPAGFKLLKRVVIMGGSIRTLEDPYGVAPPIAPHPEWNIKNDIASAKKLFQSGVPLYVMPLDSTANLKLHEVARTAIFAHGSMMTNILAGLYYEWSAATRASTPTLYDPMTLASMLDPSLCPTTPMHIDVDDAGNTKETPGTPNAHVCLHSDDDAFLRFYVKRVTSAAVSKLATSSISGSERSSKPERH
ncbi:MAG TPA: nucleoside hydrolase [Rhizomicrobium sp.]|jgi:inosine-uridine nucleoside N-ribohydrolase